jgi:uncharacterized repeat protein (TIGR01451 family)
MSYRRSVRVGSAVLLVIAAGAFSAYALGQGGSTGVDLATEKTDSPDPVQVGQQLVYTIKVTNQGTADATGVTVTDELPSSVDFVSASNQCSFNQGTRTVTCSIGNLAAGASQSVQIRVRPREDGKITNRATATASENDVSPSNDRGTARTTVNPQPGPVPTCAGRPATIVDRNGNDPVTGTPGNDVILTGRRDDEIRARRGNDLVCAGLGGDLVIGGPGDDQLRGGGGADALRGARDDDQLFGGRRRDRLNGGSGEDACDGGPGRDRELRCES